MIGFWHRFITMFTAQPPEQAKLEKRVQQLQFDVNKVASDLTAIREQTGQSCEIRIEKVCVDKVNLDQIVFHIDGMSVKELGGSLSIGLNYGGKVIRVEAPPKQQPGESEKGRAGKPPPTPGGTPHIKVNFHNEPREGESSGRKPQPL